MRLLQRIKDHLQTLRLNKYDRMLGAMLSKPSLVLDIGSGIRPFPYADVLCDIKPTLRVKPFVVCDVSFLPFRNHSFDFVVCRHVLEHVENPWLAFRELRRVARHGYIEAPSWISENVLYGWDFHRWTLTVRKGELCVSRPRRICVRGKTILPLGWLNLQLFLPWRIFDIFLNDVLDIRDLRYKF